MVLSLQRKKVSLCVQVHVLHEYATQVTLKPTYIELIEDTLETSAANSDYSFASLLLGGVMKPDEDTQN